MTEQPKPTTASTNGKFDDDDDGGLWIPLGTETTEKSNREETTSSSVSSSSTTTTTTTATQQSTTVITRSVHMKPIMRQNAKLQSLQERLENRIILKQSLLDQPLDMLWKRFFVNLLGELWRLEIHVRLGLIMVATGILLKAFLLVTWYLWYPKIAILLVLLLASAYYLDPLDFQRKLERLGRIKMSPDFIVETLEQLDVKQIRRLAFFVFFVPTALEMRTISFLSQIKAESGWIPYNIVLAALNFFLMGYLHKTNAMKPRECIYNGLLVLYGSALFVTVIKTDIRKIPILAAPFFTATGTLLLTYRDDDMEWISRVFRQALRLALRDVLSSLNEKLTEDEMLQLAILRWIADYWAYTPTDPTAPNQPTAHETRHSQSSTSSTQSGATPTRHTSSSSSGSTETSPPRSGLNGSDRRELEWEELLPMLGVATDHMTNEVRMLQAESRNKESETTGSTSSSGGATSNRRPSMPERPSGIPPAANSQPEDDMFAGLTVMLKSFDVDEKARPAVAAYRRAVESFPPTKKTAFIISAMRRCPAMLTLAWHVLFGSASLFSSTILILPFVVFEYKRIEAWIASCERATADFGNGLAEEQRREQQQEDDESEEAGIPAGLARTDAMTILVCGDTFQPLQPPVLLLVWQNILGSVSALERGLSVARCVQTTAVAAEFASNVMSLVQLGFEVHQHGLGHGLAVMAKELMTLHARGLSPEDAQGATKYSHAAMGAVQNAQMVARNIHTLAEEEKLDPILQPVVWVLCTLTGHGWIWGNDDADEGSEEKNNPSGTSRSQQEEQYNPNEDNNSFVDRQPAGVPDPSHTDSTEKKDEDTEKQQSVRELSEIMQMIATAYEKGLVSSEEKNHWYEKMAKLSQSDEISNPVIIAGMKHTLQIVLDNGQQLQHEQEQEEGEEQVKEQDVTTIDLEEKKNHVMMLASKAYKEGRIDQKEKNSFRERISQMENNSKSNDDTEGIITNMIRSLEAVMEGDYTPPSSYAEQTDEEVSSSDAATGSSLQGAGSWIFGDQGSLSFDGKEKGKDMEKEKEVAAEETGIDVQSLPKETIDISEESSPSASTKTVAVKEDDDVLQEMKRSYADDKSPGGGSILDDQASTTKTTAANVKASNRGGTSSNTSSSNEGTQQEENSEGGNDAWMKFGLAAVGVVAGGMLMSMKGGEGNKPSSGGYDNNDGDRGDDHDGGHNTSTVHIEELDGDGDDDWVSIPASN